MNRIEEAPHIHSLFRQYGNDDVKKIKLVLRLRDEALKYLSASVTARDAELTPSQQHADALLYACTKAIEANTVSDWVQQTILYAYAGLDLDAVVTGKKFTQGRQPNTGSVIRKAIGKLLKRNPAMKTPELWDVLASKPPKGWQFFNNRAGKYTEGPKTPGDGHSYARFCTIASEERKQIKR